MSSVRVSPRVRHDARQSAPAFQRVGPSEKASATRVKSSKAQIVPGVLPVSDHPENFKDCSKCNLWIVAQRPLSPVTDYSPLDPFCAHCSRKIEIVRH